MSRGSCDNFYSCLRRQQFALLDSPKMMLLTVAFVLSSLAPVKAVVQWSAWLGASECSRKCSELSGTMTYRRHCFNCSRHEDLCQAATAAFCGGVSVKTDTCYVATYCNGDGLYVGEWTEWSSPRRCPPPNDPCTGVMVTMERRCLLPEAFPARSRPFRCPSMPTTRKTVPCPCETSPWTGWSGWSACRDPCGSGDRMRRRRCEKNADGRCEGDGIQIGPCPVDRTRCKVTGTLSRVKRNTAALVVWCLLFVLLLTVGAIGFVCYRFVFCRK